jgi:hypothetical protein
VRRKGIRQAKDLVDAHGFGPAHHGKKIDLATLDIVLCKLESLFIDQDARVVDLIRAPRGAKQG